MSKLWLLSLLTVSLAVAGSASANGGMGDSSAHLKEMNAICDMQRRGEGPLQPNMCLPEYPLGSDRNPQERRW